MVTFTPNLNSKLHLQEPHQVTGLKPNHSDYCWILCICCHDICLFGTGSAHQLDRWSHRRLVAHRAWLHSQTLCIISAQMRLICTVSHEFHHDLPSQHHILVLESGVCAVARLCEAGQAAVTAGKRPLFWSLVDSGTIQHISWMVPE